MKASQKIAFKMFLNAGQQEEYQRRHDGIWPELIGLLKDSGICDYSIYLDETHHVLFAVLHATENHTMDALSQHPVMQQWWQYMKDIMRCHADGSPVVEPLPCLFHLD